MSERYDSIPAELRAPAQWVAWRADPPRGDSDKPTKVPISPATGAPAKTNDSNTWGFFEEAVKRAEADGLAGIGFVFTKHDEYIGVDLDGCRNPETGELEERAQEIVQSLNTYTEVSPSGTGVHAIAKGTLPPGGRGAGKVEMYDSGRFFTMTGDRVPGTPATIEERSAALEMLHFECFGVTLDGSERREVSTPVDGSGDQLIGAGVGPDDGMSFSSHRDEDDDPYEALAHEDGLSDDEVIARAKMAENGAKFAALWEGDHSAYDSPSEADLALCSILAFWTGGNRPQIDRLFRRSGLMRPKWDELRGERPYGRLTIQKALEDRTEFYEAPAGPSDGGGGSVATQIVDLVQEHRVELFHDEAGETYASTPVDGHVETWRIRDRAFERWLGRVYYEKCGRAAAASAFSDACRVLDGKAVYEGTQDEVHVRLAEKDGCIYLDLARDDWRVVEISPNGWKVLDQAPVRFRRPRALLELPVPERGGNILDLRPFVNVTDSDWPLVLGWLVAALRPTGPFPHLALLGEQGAAKSTTARVLRNLVDPNSAALRAGPREGRDLMIAASNAWVLAFDNLGKLPQWLSDAMCRLSTGGGFATRALYQNDEEMIFEASRPGILTGIEDIVDQSDLLDRVVVTYAPRIEPSDRQSERAFNERFTKAQPRIMGALLDAVSVGLRRLPTTELDSMPRMADFALWVTACEPGLELAPGTFLRAYERNRDTVVDLALESSPVAPVLREFMDARGEPLEATAGEILSMLADSLGDAKPPPGWPKSARGLSGDLRKVAPDLRAVGLAIEFDIKRGGRRLMRIEMSQETGPTGPTGPNIPETTPTTPSGGPVAPSEGAGRDSPTDPPEPPTVTPSGGAEAGRAGRAGCSAEPEDAPPDASAELDPEFPDDLPVLLQLQEGLFETQDGRRVQFSRLTPLGCGKWITLAGRVRIVDSWDEAAPEAPRGPEGEYVDPEEWGYLRSLEEEPEGDDA